MILPEQLIRDAKKKIALSETEKAFIRSHLLTMMAMYPLPGQVLSPFIRRKVWQFSLHYAPAALAVVLVLSTTVAAAENALPGDKLYPIKTSVNEEVVALVTVSPKSSAEWQARRAERRLEEAVILASDGKLTAEKSATIQSSFKEHIDKVEDNLADMEAKDQSVEAIDVTSKFEANLRAHEQILTQLSEQKPEVTQITAAVEAKAEAVAEDRKTLETKVVLDNSETIKTAAEERLKTAMAKVEEVRQVMEQAKLTGDNEAVSAAQAKISVAEELIAEGKNKFGNKSFGEAFLNYQAASRLSQEGQALIQVQAKLNIDIEIPDQTGTSTTTATSTATSTATTTATTTATSTATSSPGAILKKLLP